MAAMASLITQYLTRTDIVACMCVCREWEALFTPCLWSDISLEEIIKSCGSCPPRRPAPPALWHGPSIRRLSVNKSALRSKLNKKVVGILSECRNIEELLIDNGDDDDDNNSNFNIPQQNDTNEVRVWSTLCELVLTNPQIKRVHLDYLNCYIPSLMMAVTPLPGLRHFQASLTKVDYMDLHEMFLRLDTEEAGTRNSESGLHLTLLFTTVLEPWHLLSSGIDVTHQCVTHLYLMSIIGLDWDQHCTLICRLPNLVFLDWAYSKADQEPAVDAAADVATKVLIRCPRIKRLIFFYGTHIPGQDGGRFECRMSDKEHAQLIQTLSADLKELLLYNTTFSKHSFWALTSRSFFYITMRELDLGDCIHFTGVMALECLESCSGLVRFVAPSISAFVILKKAERDDKRMKPWACRNLRYLKARFSGMLSIRPPGPHARKADQTRYRDALWQHKLIFAKLAQLKWLEQIRLGYPGRPLRMEEDDPEESADENAENSDNSEGELMLTLEAGLYALTTLRRLRFLGLRGLGQKLTMEDAQWMKEHWPVLEEVRGKMHLSMTRHHQLVKIAIGN
ncbi:hypothetical protein BG006_010885 [Podila minutissima]|uniref:F-box domain-containing protein n=1 Tax=Podila minutissima TaxID=64525 RepID=A0A9P5VI91_9FUNG|nr:hypothetical protein BG006_010885 [Podila minutissima]